MNYIDILREQFNSHIRFRERRTHIQQLIVPLFHEDGDMIDVFLDTSLNGKMIRVCDLGMTYTRLSYSLEIDTPIREKILTRILEENHISELNGNLFIDSPVESLYPSILQLAQVITKVSSMRFYRKWYSLKLQRLKGVSF